MPNTNPAALLWTEDDAAAAMGLEVGDVQGLVDAGELTPVRILTSPTLRFRPADIADLVDRLATPAPSPSASSKDAAKPGAAPAAPDMNALIRGAR